MRLAEHHGQQVCVWINRNSQKDLRDVLESKATEESGQASAPPTIGKGQRREPRTQELQKSKAKLTEVYQCHTHLPDFHNGSQECKPKMWEIEKVLLVLTHRDRHVWNSIACSYLAKVITPKVTVSVPSTPQSCLPYPILKVCPVKASGSTQDWSTEKCLPQQTQWYQSH